MRHETGDHTRGAMVRGEAKGITVMHAEIHRMAGARRVGRFTALRGLFVAIAGTGGLLSMTCANALPVEKRERVEMVGLAELRTVLDGRTGAQIDLPLEWLGESGTVTRRGTAWHSHDGAISINTLRIPANEASLRQFYRSMRNLEDREYHGSPGAEHLARRANVHA